MSEPRAVTGGCLCGALRYVLHAPLRDLCYCHCSSCRRAAGAATVPWGTVLRASFVVTRGVLTEHRSSPQVTRGFCATCGAGLTYHTDARATDIDIALASLDAPERFAPEAHVWVADKLPWVHISDGLPQFAAGLPPHL